MEFFKNLSKKFIKDFLVFIFFIKVLKYALKNFLIIYKIENNFLILKFI